MYDMRLGQQHYVLVIHCLLVRHFCRRKTENPKGDLTVNSIRLPTHSLEQMCRMRKHLGLVLLSLKFICENTALVQPSLKANLQASIKHVLFQ